MARRSKCPATLAEPRLGADRATEVFREADRCVDAIRRDPAAELSGVVTAIDIPLPDRIEIRQLVEQSLQSVPPEIRAIAEKDMLDNKSSEAVVDSAGGLTAREVENCYSKSLVSTRKLDPKIIGSEKKRVIARERVLSWFDPYPRGMAAIGGLDIYKNWCAIRRTGFSTRAREFGLPAPKGI